MTDDDASTTAGRPAGAMRLKADAGNAVGVAARGVRSSCGWRVVLGAGASDA